MRSVLLVLACACGHPPAKPVETRLHEVPRPSITVPTLPPISIADLDPADVRWPLTRDPVVAPHADLVTIFRSRHHWQALCPARGDPRDVEREEVLDYLHAWCAHAATGNGDALRRTLVPLATGTSYSIAKAARADLVDLLAFELPGASALAFLRSHQLAHPDQLDRLAASYQALGRDRDAAAIVIAGRDPKFPGPPADHCRRLLRDHVLTGRPVATDAIALPDPTCARILTHVGPSPCLLETKRWPTDACTNHKCESLANQLVATCGAIATSKAAVLVAAFHVWPAGEPASVWIEYARFASDALELAGAVELVAAALENASLIGNCASELPAIVELARVARSRAPTHCVLSRLAELTPTTCLNRASPTLGRHQRDNRRFAPCHPGS
jgi:hypothetical protein